MITPARRALVRAHRADRGNLGVLSLFVAFAMLALIFMIWNTGEVSARRVHTQRVADTAAHGASTIVARATNVVTADNMIILRAASAETLAAAAVPTIRDVHRRLKFCESLANIMLASIYPKTVAAGAALMVKVRFEQAVLLRFSLAVMPAVARLPTYGSSIRRVYRHQEQVVRHTPGLVEDYRRALARDQSHRLWIGPTSRRSRVAPPVKPGNVMTILNVLRQRVYADRRGWMPTMRQLRLGRGESTWRRYTDRFTPLIAAKTPHHALATAWGPLETPNPTGVSDADRLNHFSLIAVASTREATRPPFFEPVYLRPAGGRDAVERRGAAGNPHTVAYAQGEVFNANEFRHRFRSPTTPWRVWSKPGFEWRPRLASAFGLGVALQAHREPRRMFQRGWLDLRGTERLEHVNHH